MVAAVYLLQSSHSLGTLFNSSSFQEGLFRVSPSAIDEIIMSHASQKKESPYVLYILQLDPPGDILLYCSSFIK